MLNIALFGPPGAGKGTQSRLLLEKYNLAYIATGDILRQEIKEGTDLGIQAKSIIDQGGLVSDEIIVQIIERKITMNPEASGFLFDGFPRTVVQAYILEGLLLKLNTSLSVMISLDVPKNQLIERLVERGKTSGRSDDTPDIIQNRLDEYDHKTAPVADFYKEKGIFKSIQGVGEISEVFERLSETIDQKIKSRLLNIVFFGYPGAGKGTQANLLAKQFNLTYISTGNMFRHEINIGSDIGKMVQPYLESGDIVPDEIAIKLIEKEIKKNSDTNGYIFKGFPRTLVQAYILDGLLQKINSTVACTIDFHIPPLEAIKRLSARAKSKDARSYDMDTDVIVHRLEEYEKITLPALKYYEKMNKVCVIDARGSEKEVYKRVMEKAERALKQIR